MSKHTIEFYCQGFMGVKNILSESIDDEQYARYLKRQFPIRFKRFSGSIIVNIWLNDKDEIHRDGNLPAWKTDGGYCEYRVNGKLHRTDGLAIQNNYWFDGVKYEKEEWEKVILSKSMKSVYFLREKIIALQKLLEIPELYQEVYYSRKSEFLGLLKKL